MITIAIIIIIILITLLLQKISPKDNQGHEYWIQP